MLCTSEIVNQSVELPLIGEGNYVKNSDRKYEDNRVWVTVPPTQDMAQQDLPYVYLQQPYGVQAPRLINSGRGKAATLLPTVSAKGGENYHMEETAVWKITKNE